MWKDALIVATAAAIGEFGARKFGATIETKAVSMKIPPAVAHAAVVGAAAMGGYLLIKAIL